MKLTFPTINKRRYRRLALALFAALTVHIALVLMANIGIYLFTTPSNQDRLLTLTLKNTSYEGLKETKLVDQDTINDAKLAEAADPTKAVQVQAKSKVASKPVQPSQTNNDIGKGIANKTQEQFKEIEEHTEPLKTKPLKNSVSSSPINKLSQQQSSAISPPSELISSAKLSTLKINEHSALKAKDQHSSESLDESLEASEIEMITKKINRWSAKTTKAFTQQSPLTWKKNGHQYTAIIEKIPAQTDMQMDHIFVEVSTDRDGKKLSTTLRLKKMAFSNFTQFVHQWDPDVSVHKDEVNGRFHSNTRLNLIANKEGAPLFHGKVTTASYFVDIQGNVPRKDIFLAGLERGVKKIAMPKPSSLFEQAQSDNEVNSRLIKKSARLIFKSDGSYLLQNLNDIGVIQRHPIGDKPLYLLAAPGVNLLLSGIVNGAVTVYSPEHITIEGSLEYLSTKDIEQGGDFLGLISERNVSIAKRKVIPAGDLNIHAAIYAKNRFTVRQFNVKHAGTLTIFGSVSAGSLTATEPRYTTNIIFDPRLENLRPPGFPVTDRYELLAQKNNWQVNNTPFFESNEPLE